MISPYYTMITGATKGIGLSIAKELAAKKHNLILIARDTNLLAAISDDLIITYAVQVKYISVDLSEIDSITKIKHFLIRNKIFVNILVNNAGFGMVGAVHETDVKILTNMIHTNCRSLLELSHLLINYSLIKTKGHIVNIASTASFQPGPYMATYYASKAFVLSLSEAMSVELKPLDIKVTTICPGPVATAFHERSGSIKSLLSKGKLIKVHTPDFIAKRTVKAIENDIVLCIPGLMNKILIITSRFLPRSFIRYITGKINKP